MAKLNQELTSKSEVFLKSSEQFRTALRRVINQSSVSANGDAKPYPRQQLSKHAGIATSTLNKYLISDEIAKDEPPNPTLEVICKLGEALNVPPALLLMTNDDWTKLANGMETYMKLLNSNDFLDYISKTVQDPNYSCRPSDIANDAFQIAKKCGFGSLPTNTAKTTIAATSQTLPLREINPNHRPLLMAVCAIFALSAPQSAISLFESE